MSPSLGALAVDPMTSHTYRALAIWLTTDSMTLFTFSQIPPFEALQLPRKWVPLYNLQRTVLLKLV